MSIRMVYLEFVGTGAMAVTVDIGPLVDVPIREDGPALAMSLPGLVSVAVVLTKVVLLALEVDTA